jgi:serine protease Do
MAGADNGAATSDKEPDKNITEKVGFTVGNLTAERREQLGLDNSAGGVVVLDVDPSSWASQKGLQAGDLVKRIKAKGREAVEVKNVDGFNRILKETKKGDPVMFYLERQGQSFFIAVKIQ